MSEEIVIHLHDRAARMAGRIQLMQDVASVIALVPPALVRVHSTDILEKGFAILEFLAVAVLGATTVKELRDREHDVAGVAWANIVIGIILIIENTLRVHEGQHKVFSPTLLTGISSIVLGLIDGKLKQRKKGHRNIRITDTNLHVRLGKFRKFNLAWSDVTGIEEGGKYLTIHVRDGRNCRIRLNRYDNGAEVRTAITGAAQKHAIALTHGS
jgi:hypothetical protein